MRNFLRSILILQCLGISAVSFGMTVEEAYKAIPHARTVFDRSAATMSRDEQDYLVHLFKWIDQAIVAKVTAMQGQPVSVAYKKVLPLPKILVPPYKLAPLQNLAVDSVQAEYDYLKARQAAGVRTFNAGDPHVQTASQRAHAAYAELMRLYPTENAHNKQAFFDYLCALDFI